MTHAARLGALLLGTLGLCVSVAAVEPGDPAPPFVLSELEGEGAVALADLAGRVVLLDFWASWCAPCREALPYYSGLHDELSERGLAVLAVNVDDRLDDARRFVDERALLQPMLRDADGQVARRFGVSVMPAAFVIDRNSVVRMAHVGFDAGHAAETRALILDLLAQPAATSPGDPSSPGTGEVRP